MEASTSKPVPLFELIHLPSRLAINKIYLNGLHSVRGFAIRNISPHPITVKLKSNLGSQIAFQLQNENLAMIEALSQEDLLIATNTVDSARTNDGYANGLNHTVFHELFNSVGFVDEVSLDVNETKQVFLLFLPDAKLRPRKKSVKKPAPEDSPETAAAHGDYAFEQLDVNGMLFFFAYRVDEKAPLSLPDTPAVVSPMDSQHTFEGTLLKHLDHLNTPQTADLNSPRDHGPHSEARAVVTAEGPSARPPDYQTSVKFRSKVCKSFMSLDVTEAGLAFEDCVVGGTYQKDLLLWNRSEIDLFWRINACGIPGSLSFSVVNALESEATVPLAPFSCKKIRVVYKPKEIGEFSYNVRFENSNDLANTIDLGVHAVVRSVPKEETLVFPDGRLLDFGDCVSGTWNKQTLKIKNVSQYVIDIAFAPEGANMFFAIRTNDIKGSTLLTNELDLQKNLTSSNEKAKEKPPVDLMQPNEISNAASSVSSRNSSPAITTKKESDLLHALSVDLIDALALQSAVSESNNNRERYDDYTKVDEVQLLPGSERSIQVWYQPEKEPITPDKRAAKLTKRHFKINLNCTRHDTKETDRKFVQCKAKSCTSIVEVLPRVVDFGDSDVGTLKTTQIQIFNISDLPSRVELRFISKVLFASHDEIVIPGNQSVDVKLDFLPRKANPDYKKQVNIVNLLNRDNDHVIEVRASNMDRQMLSFHSLFYRIITPSKSNSLDFGTAVLNSSSVRTFSIENTSRKNLTLMLSTSLPDELKLYFVPLVEPAAQKDIDTVKRREYLLESISERRKRSSRVQADSSLLRNREPSLLNLRRHSQQFDTPSLKTNDYLDLAAGSAASSDRKPSKRTLKMSRPPSASLLDSDHSRQTGTPLIASSNQSSVNSLDDVSTGFSAGDQSSLFSDPPDGAFSNLFQSHLTNTENFTSLLEKSTGVLPPLLPKISAEEKYVRAQVLLRKELLNAISDHRLVPASSLVIAPGAIRQVIAVFTPSGTRKDVLPIFVKLLEFDHEIQHPQFDPMFKEDIESLPMREILVKSSVCRAVMELGQKNLNFGFIEKNEKRTRTIVIKNVSDSPVLYAIHKSGSIASGDVMFGENRFGIIRGYGRKEIEFMFEPSMAGAYFEKLEIENVYDHDNNLQVILKAKVRKPSNFFVQSSFLNFGLCLVGEVSTQSQPIIICNTSHKQSRQFELKVDTAGTKFDMSDLDVIFEHKVVEEDDGVLILTPGDEKKTRKKPGTAMLLTAEVEEQIEHAEQKLKIAERKGQPDKIKKIRSKLEKLRSGTFQEEKYKEDDEEEHVKELRVATAPVADKAMTHEPQSEHPAEDDKKSRIVRKLNSIVVNVEPREMKAIQVYLMARPFATTASDQPSNMEICTGKIIVNEYRNTDIIKRCLVCSDETTYAEAKEKLHSIMGQPATETDSAVFKKEISPILGSPANAPPPIVANEMDTVSLELENIDLGKIEIGEAKECYFTLRSNSEYPIFYEVLHADRSPVSVRPGTHVNGIAVPKSSTRVYLQLVSLVHGPGSHEFICRTGLRELTVRFMYYGVLRQYLEFGDQAAQTPDVSLDFGMSYVHSTKKYSKIIPYPVRNRTEKELFVSASSNLSQQCSVCLDEAMKIPVLDAKLMGGQTMMVYIGLQHFYGQPQSSPVSSSQIVPIEAIQTEASVAQYSAEVRELVGGIKFQIFVDDGTGKKQSLIAQSIKFSATIGYSHFGVSCRSIDMGFVRSINETKSAEFWVMNLSRKLPVELELVPSSSEVLQVSTTSSSSPSQVIRLEGWEKEGGKISAESKALVRLTLSPTKKGFSNVQLFIMNRFNPGMGETIDLSIFVDDASVVARKLDPSSKKAQVLSSTDKLPVLRWDPVYSMSFLEGDRFKIRAQANTKSEALTPPNVVGLEIENSCEYALSLTPKSKLSVAFHWTAPLFNEVSSMNLQLGDESWRVIGPSLELEPGQISVLYIKSPLYFSISEKQHLEFLEGKTVLLDGLMVLESSPGRAIKAFSLNVPYSKSRISLETSNIDLGKSGFSNLWKDIPFSFVVRNDAEIPACYDLRHEPHIEIRSINGDTGSLCGTKCRIKEHSSHVIEAVFKPRRAPRHSTVSTIEVFNLYNPENDLYLHVLSQITSFDIKFDKLVDGEIALPPLFHPVLSSSPLCENWFTILNNNEEQTRFVIGHDLSPDVRDLIELEVVARNTNIPIIGPVLLDPKSSLDVKVRAFPKIGTRLPLNASYLLAEQGITFGAIQVSPADQDSESLVSENISIRCRIVEAQVFSISHKKMDFAFSYDSDGEEDVVPGSTGELRPEQKKMQRLKIINLSQQFDLNFQVAVEYPVELSGGGQVLRIYPLDERMSGSVPPSGQQTLFVEMKMNGIDGLSEDIRVRIIDKNSLNRYYSTLYVGVKDSEPGSSVTESNASMSTSLVLTQRVDTLGSRRNSATPSVNTSMVNIIISQVP